jgi:hypothetical protein
LRPSHAQTIHNRPGLCYTRDSGGEHETTPSEYVRWGQRKATALGVTFTCTPGQIESMIPEGQSQNGDLFLDYGVKGNLLQRPDDPGIAISFRVP